MGKRERWNDILREHLNVFWLRPENALWCAYEDYQLHNAPYKLKSPIMDLGGGSGLHSFVTAGGRLSPGYDFFTNVGGLNTFFKGTDIYNSFSVRGKKSDILKKPNYKIDVLLDHKENLIRQAEFLGLYKKYIHVDANKEWPVLDESLNSVVSNLIYWLDDYTYSFRKLRRVLKKGGKAFLFLQTPNYTKFCMSYHPKDYPGYEHMLEVLNRGRKGTHPWQVTLPQMKKIALEHGFRIVHHSYYYSKLFLTMWDIGLRPLSPVLIDMVNTLPPARRKNYKKQWVEILHELLEPIYHHENSQELKENEAGGLFVILEKK